MWLVLTALALATRDREQLVLSAESAAIFEASHECDDDPTTEAVRDITNVDNRTVPQCVLARLPKAGGTALTKIFMDCVEENGQVLCERGSLSPLNWDRGDVVLGQVRNPFSWYASLWGYLSDRLREYGDNPFELERRGFFEPYAPSNLTSVLSLHVPYGSLLEDRIKFRQFVQLISSPSVGMLSLMMWRNYIHTHVLPIFAFKLTASVDGFLSVHKQVLASHGITLDTIVADLDAWDPEAEIAIPQHVACWIRAENATLSFRACLQQCEYADATHTPINWTRFNLTDTYEANESSPRANNTELYDEATADFVRQVDARVFLGFGYSTSVADS